MTELPPVIQLWLSETASGSADVERLGRLLKDKGLRRDLQQQAEATARTFKYADEQRSHDGLSILSVGTTAPIFEGSCAGRECRLAEARHFAETAALYAERVLVVDQLTPLLADADRRLGEERTTHLVTTTEILTFLRPLLDEGIIRLARPTRHLCRQCAQQTDSVVASAVEGLLEEVRVGLKVNVQRFPKSSRRFMSLSSPLFQINGQPRFFYTQIPFRARCTPRFVETELRKEVSHHVRRIYFSTEAAVRCGATVASSDRMTPAALRLLDGHDRGSTAPEWERQRQVQLPILEGLTPQQIVALRHEARSALPAFRQRISEGLSRAAGDADEASRRLVAELRTEAAALQSELKAINLPGVRRSGVLLSSAGLALTVFGLVNGPAIAATGMAALIATALHSTEQRRRAEGETIRLAAKPAYVALVAERLKRHSHQ